MTAMVSPEEGLPVVRLVTVPVMAAAKAVVAQSSTQVDDRRWRNVLFEIDKG
jgi:hypothetical protein